MLNNGGYKFYYWSLDAMKCLHFSQVKQSIAYINLTGNNLPLQNINLLGLSLLCYIEP